MFMGTNRDLQEALAEKRCVRACGSGRRSLWLFCVALLIAAAGCCGSLFAQTPAAAEPADLKMELRSATGSNRFQLGEVIPVEVLLSSSTANHYLEPCELFWEGCFGYPQCRFFNQWSFDVQPATGWTDVGRHGCMEISGPTFEVKSADLTPEPKQYPYTLTTRFRFDTPGRYIVRFSLTVGLDDETNQQGTQEKPDTKHHSVSKTAELVLEIVPAGDAWKKTVLEEGMSAMRAKSPGYTNPPSPAFLASQQRVDAFCNLGTAEAAVAFAKLLSEGIDTRGCIKINPHKEDAKTEMGRLLVEPDVGVRAIFFVEYTKLLSEREGNTGELAALLPEVIDQVRATLFASLPRKTPEAQIVSLETVLRAPTAGYWLKPGSVYDLRAAYSDAVIAVTAANFERLAPETQAALLDREWDHVRSPLMLGVVRRAAEKGNGWALLRWQELDPVAATAFMRAEMVLPEPRFSALFLRLPAHLLPAEEQEMARNFVALSKQEELIREATLLHRYATREVLPEVLPFIDEHLASWSCELQVPVLAYLLKVSPADARVRLEKMMKTVRAPYCPNGEFLPSLGYLEADAVLDGLAAEQITDLGPLADDAAAYLRRYGSASMKPVVWEQFARWHRKYVESGAETRSKAGSVSPADYSFGSFDVSLRDAYMNAHGWMLSPQDVDKLYALLDEKDVKSMACNFNCHGLLSVGPGAGTYYIYGRVTDPLYPPNDRTEYLMSTEPYQYQINQYGCRNLESLEEKLLQFPAGSKFSFAYTGSGQDVGDWAAISGFLHSHGYVTGN